MPKPTNYWIYYKTLEPVIGEKVTVRECPICHAWVIQTLDQCPNCKTYLKHPMRGV